MLPTEQREFFGLVQRCLSDYLKPPTPADLEAWWATCRVFTLADVDGVLKAHQMDPEDGRRAPRPIDVKRRLSVKRPAEGRCDLSHGDCTVEELQAYWAQRDVYAKRVAASPSVKNTAHAISLKHGSKPWGGSYAGKSAEDLI